MVEMQALPPYGRTKIGETPAHVCGAAVEATVPLGTTFFTEGGCACWTPPPGMDVWPDERSARFDAALRQVCDEADIERLGVMSSAMDEHHPAIPHWYLGAIAVRRSAQGHGIGTALLEYTLTLVDEAGTPAYLESTNPRNISLYERHGFRVTGRIELPGGPALIPMWREAN